MGNIDRIDHSLSAGGIIMIVIAAIGVLTAFTTIICLFVTSKKRNRVNQRIESAATRSVVTPRSPNRPQTLNPSPASSPHVRTILPMFPDLSELAKYPPSYEEAMRMSSPTTPITPNASRGITPSGTPPPAFEESPSNLITNIVVPPPSIHLTPPQQTSPLKNNESALTLESTSEANPK